jgi:F-type H+-transporting ATPase subunit b
MAAHPPVVDTHGAEAVHGAAEAGAHGGEAAAGFPPFEAGLFASQLFWFALTFGVLYLVVSRFVLPKVGGVLAARAGTIASDLDQAAQKSAAADEARTSMERAVAKARADARGMIDAARADVQAKLNAEQEAAETRLADRITTAEARVDAARQKALAEVPGIADALARDIADKIAPTNASAPRQRVAGEA